MSSQYYDSVKETVANSLEVHIPEGHIPHFPKEGLCIGRLFGPKMEVPALVDLCERPAIGFLYNSEDLRNKVNLCIEQLAWRLAVCLPPKQCRFILYNGGQPGSAFNTHSLINDFLFSSEGPKVYFDGSSEKFEKCLDGIYDSILERLSLISRAGADNLVELNESLGKKSSMFYQFIILTDFPMGLSITCAEKLYRIIKASSKAGIFVLMSWDMNARFEEDRYASRHFDPQAMLQEMELIYPAGDRIIFRNSGHDEVLNRFLFEIAENSVGYDLALTMATCIDRQVQEATKVEKRGIIKQDFNSLRAIPYEPVSSEISVTIGEDIATKNPVMLKFNSGDYIHAFILGQSGSGKSVLINNIVSSLMLKYSPEDLMFYLMDFKGVEFNRYRGEKHTKAVLVDNSDPQMTLEVLRELREENKRRVKLWQNAGVNNIDRYNCLHLEDRIPQILFVADECQIMFQTPKAGGVQMAIHREISEILNTIATQGRSQGIHMLLATQQLDETDISGQVLKNLTECLLLMSAPSDSNRLVPDSSDKTAKQATGLACYYHKKELTGQVQTYYASEEELSTAISDAQKKAGNSLGNGEAYFCGSSVFRLTESDLSQLDSRRVKYPLAMIGHNIGLKGNTTTIPLREDYSENILFFGVNKEYQTTHVLINALYTLILSYKALNKPCDFLVIDCLNRAEAEYRQVLETLEEKGYCHLIERTRSGFTFKAIAEDIQNDRARPVVLAIIGSERFIEMKRNSVMNETIAAPETIEGFEPLGFSDPFGGSKKKDISKMTFQQVFTFILDEGPMQDVHILLQVDKPGNILFEGDYGGNATDKFRHKVILRSENKFLGPLRFSQDIDVENLSDEEEHLRAYYYPEGDDPVLFTPFLLPDSEIFETINKE